MIGPHLYSICTPYQEQGNVNILVKKRTLRIERKELKI